MDSRLPQAQSANGESSRASDIGPVDAAPAVDDDRADGEREKSPGDNREYELLVLPIEQLIGNEKQARTTARKKQTWRELVDSIRRYGIKQPLLVRAIGAEKYVVVDGHGRLAAAREAGLKVVPCLLEKDALHESENLRLQFQTNQLHERLSPLDQARLFQELMESHGWKQTQVQEYLGISQSCVSQYLTVLNKGSEAIKEKVQSGELNVKKAALFINDQEKKKKEKEKAKKAAEANGADEQLPPLPSPASKKAAKSKSKLVAYDELEIRDDTTGLQFVVLGKKKTAPPIDNVIVALRRWLSQLELQVKHDV